MPLFSPWSGFSDAIFNNEPKFLATLSIRTGAVIWSVSLIHGCLGPRKLAASGPHLI